MPALLIRSITGCCWILTAFLVSCSSIPERNPPSAKALPNLIFTFSPFEMDCKSSRQENHFDSLFKAHTEKFMPAAVDAVRKVPFEYISILNPSKPAPAHTVKDSYHPTIPLPPIDTATIIRTERSGAHIAAVYHSGIYDDFVHGGAGYWIALSNDNGRHWGYYYTGLTSGFFYAFKEDSSIPLWKNKDTLQVETRLVRQSSRVIHPLPPIFEELDTSVIVQMDIKGLIKDSDKDGLTDIEEYKMLLNPFNPDTDKDGINDRIDTNPRYKSNPSAKAILYQALIEGPEFVNGHFMTIDVSEPLLFPPDPPEDLTTDLIHREKHFLLIVSDDQDLQHINLQNHTAIIMSANEYKSYRTKFPAHFIRRSISPLFPCDSDENRFKLHISYLTSSSGYLIVRTKTGWNVWRTSMTIA